jgi:hypothetical protein
VIVAVVMVVIVVNCWLLTKGADNSGITDRTNRTDSRTLVDTDKEVGH